MPGLSNVLRQAAVKHKILLTIFCTKLFLLARRPERGLPQFLHVNRWKRDDENERQHCSLRSQLDWQVFDFPKEAGRLGDFCTHRRPRRRDWGETNPVYSSLYGCLISETHVSSGVIHFPFHSLLSFRQFGWLKDARMETWHWMRR